MTVPLRMDGDFVMSTTRPCWIDRLAEDDRARWFRHFTIEQFRQYVTDGVEHGIPERCDDPLTIATVAAIATREGDE